MEKRHIRLVIFGILFALGTFPSLLTLIFDSVGLMNPFGRDYSLTDSNILIEITNSGTLYVSEDIGYKFKGCFKEVFRELNIKRQEDIEFSEGLSNYNFPFLRKIKAKCEPVCTIYDRGYEIAGYFGQICDTEARFLLSYDIYNGISQGRDVAEFHYKVWGDQWEKNLNKLNGKIILPEGANLKNTNVFFNPYGIVKDYWFEDNKIKFQADGLSSYLEVRLLMPKDVFLKDSLGVIKDFTKSEIINLQEDYESSYKNIRNFYYIIITLLALSIILIPWIIFNKYGKEPRISYNAIFEREPIKGLKPYIINSLCVGKLGKIDKNAITATLMDLIRRKHIEIEEITIHKKSFFNSKKEKDLLLKFKNNSHDKLRKPEKLLIDFLKGFSENGLLKWSDFIADLKNYSKAREFVEFQEDFDDAVHDSYNLKDFFDDRGNILFKTFCGIMIFLSILGMFIVHGLDSLNIYPFLSKYPYIIGISIIVASLVGLFLSSRIFGRFTPQGYEIYKKSMNLKKFLTDMTLLKQYPPKSIILWEELLVYATLFGVAEKVIEQMKVTVDESMVRSSSLYPIYNLYFIASINRSFAVAASTLPAGAGGSIGGFGGGGIGGGFGGGGGGAR